MTAQRKDKVRLIIKPIVCWFDLWIGVYIDRTRRRVYFFPLPCVGLRFELVSESIIDIDALNAGDKA